MNTAAKTTAALAALVAGAFALERSAVAHEATSLGNSTQVYDCGYIVATVSRSDFIDCESYHANSNSCEDNAHSRKRQLENGVGAFCETKVRELKGKGCEKTRILYHQHRGNKHEAESGFEHDHWVKVHASVVCK